MDYKRFPLGALWTNGYLFWDSHKRGFFVDPGGEVCDVIAFLEEQKIHLEWILLTHGHIDHIGGIPMLAPYASKGVAVATEDEKLLNNPNLNLSQWMGLDFEGWNASLLLADSDQIQIGEYTISVIATPGHTPGSICYVVKKHNESLLLSGDTLFARSVGRTDLPGGDSEILALSLRKLTVLPDTMPVLPGHGPETTIGQEREWNPFWPDRESQVK
ncbi:MULTISPECIES: MBL fold metallo-hydrolase [Aminobacterium]|jgi:glyoxylase-like metal-dependent hydrolase (beta-lactamase superfamily II)|uniref:MBL fold metallo-hydrolase n=1 Tax=Aminobacterium TaxID=81466 RepID=UPI002579F400|nr:MBL fold metallo-hydrolase [Aminobacterium sp. UBA4987]